MGRPGRSHRGFKAAGSCGVPLSHLQTMLQPLLSTSTFFTDLVGLDICLKLTQFPCSLPWLLVEPLMTTWGLVRDLFRYIYLGTQNNVFLHNNSVSR